jgi:hypothetical protein
LIDLGVKGLLVKIDKNLHEQTLLLHGGLSSPLLLPHGELSSPRG